MASRFSSTVEIVSSQDQPAETEIRDFGSYAYAMDSYRSHLDSEFAEPMLHFSTAFQLHARMQELRIANPDFYAQYIERSLEASSVTVL